MTRAAPFSSRYAIHGMVCSVDHLASDAGIAVLRAGGSAADAAVAASAVLAVTTQHMCGMGGDLFALVHEGGPSAPQALNASGRAGSGANAAKLRADGHDRMPAYGDIRAVPVPGCVDGWVALHERFGRLPMRDVLAAAHDYAAGGFPASPLLVATAPQVTGKPVGRDFLAATHPGAVVRRPGVARALAAVAESGRAGFYGGEFGNGLRMLAPSEFSRDDLARVNADWVEPLSVEAFGHRLWTVPPNSQGYLTLAGAWIADGLPLPRTTDSTDWAHLLIEAARQAAYDRNQVLHEDADGAALVSPDRLAPRRAAIRSHRAARLGDSSRPGGTIFLCAVDDRRMGVSLIQSNAAGFGARIAEPQTGIFLQNRGIGFSLEPGHPAEYAPGRRPPHTLAPAIVTSTDNRLEMVVGTMGGDSQPQILLQLLSRMLRYDETVADAIAAPRWQLTDGRADSGFSTWDRRGDVRVLLEPGTPERWRGDLIARGHDVHPEAGNYGHAHAIRLHRDHLEGASDPRALIGAAAGY